MRQLHETHRADQEDQADQQRDGRTTWRNNPANVLSKQRGTATTGRNNFIVKSGSTIAGVSSEVNYGRI